MELKRFKRTLRQVLILPIVACLVLAGVLVWQIAQSNSTVTLIERSDRRIALATSIEKYVVDEETGLRGYQVTSDPRFLQPYLDAQGPMQQAVAELQSITSPEQEQALNQFLSEHQTWREGFAEPVIATIRAGGKANDDDVNLTGRARMDTMRALLDRIVQASQQSSADRITIWRQQCYLVYVVLVMLTLAVGIIIGLFTRDRLEAVSLAFRRSLDLQRHRAEELFHSEQNLRTTLSSIGDGVITCDAHGRVQMMNPVAQELTGWLESQARNRPLDEVFHILNETTRQPARESSRQGPAPQSASSP